MPHIEIDENEYNRLKGVADLAARIHADPKGRVLLEQAHKTINPKAPTPTLEQEARFAEPLNNVQQQIAELTKLVTTKFEQDAGEKKLGALRQQQEEGFARLRDQGYTDQGIEAVQKIMSEKGVLEPELAAAYHEKLNPPNALATPTGSNSVHLIDSFNDESDKNLQALLQSRGDSEQALNRMITDSLNDFRKSVPTRR